MDFSVNPTFENDKLRLTLEWLNIPIEKFTYDKKGNFWKLTMKQQIDSISYELYFRIEADYFKQIANKPKSFINGKSVSVKVSNGNILFKFENKIIKTSGNKTRSEYLYENYNKNYYFTLKVENIRGINFQKGKENKYLKTPIKVYRGGLCSPK
jgi:hypothetical protein